MRTWHNGWKRVAEKMELLLANPRNFVREHGHSYDLTLTDAERFWDSFRKDLPCWLCAFVYFAILVALLSLP